MMDLLIHYKYLAYFIGMILGGDIVLITAIYLATRNVFDIRLLVALGFTATVISDLIWYYIGKHLTTSRLERLPFFNKKQNLIDSISSFMDKHGFKALLYSKFIYGTRTIIQLLAGIKKLSISKYLIVNSIGTIGYIILLVTLGYVLHISTAGIQAIIHNGALVLAIFVTILFVINLWINKNVKKHLFQ